MSRDKRLLDAYHALRGERFDWRENNCGLMASTIAQTYAGRDFAAEYRPLCESALSAMRLVKAKGGLAGVMGEIGLSEIPVAMASRGDALLFEWTTAKGRAREALGILLDWRGAFPGRDGVELIEQLKCARAWRVPSGASALDCGLRMVDCEFGGES